MGNAQVKEKGKSKTLNDIINFIATNYILTQSFEDMESLKDPKYCDKLIVVTSDVLNKYLNLTTQSEKNLYKISKNSKV